MPGHGDESILCTAPVTAGLFAPYSKWRRRRRRQLQGQNRRFLDSCDFNACARVEPCRISTRILAGILAKTTESRNCPHCRFRDSSVPILTIPARDGQTDIPTIAITALIYVLRSFLCCRELVTRSDGNCRPNSLYAVLLLQSRTV